MSVERSLMGLGCELHGLLGRFLAGEMVFFAVVRCGGAMSVGSLFVKFGGALVRVVGHDASF